MKKYFYGLAILFLFTACGDDTESLESRGVNSSDSISTDTSMNMPASEIADARYTELGKQLLHEFESRNFDAYKSYLADDAVYIYSSGDSIVGKEAIASYWNNRFTQHIDSLTVSNDIWLPININTPQQGPDMKGVWLMNWHQVQVKYKSGKSIGFWVHMDYHFNDQDKIDRAVAYVDGALINEAMKK
jgi:hypothetical protein